MKLLICTVGLPRCGKSTWVREQGHPIVCPDAIRLALYGQRFWAPGEKLVWATADLMVRALFEAGNEVIIFDATNTKRRFRDQWKSDNWHTVFHHIDTPKAECIRRAIETEQHDLVSVIEEMAKEFEPLERDEPRYVEY